MTSAVADIVRGGVAAGAFPAAVVELGDAGGPRWRFAAGRHTHDATASPTGHDTIFDLASLTKVLATTPVVMRLLEQRILDLEAPVSQWLPSWTGADRADVTVRDLLSHCSGLTAHLHLYRDCSGEAEFESTIGSLPLEYRPRATALYSDLGFILLGFVCARAAGRPFADVFGDVARLVAPEPLTFTPGKRALPRVAPTGHDPWRGRLLHGEVHDGNAWALGGVAGHAGLFGTAAAVGRVARLVLQGLHGVDTALARAATVRHFARRTAIAGSSRALGWDTMLPTSSCGGRMSPAAIGHTGFTGTSLWIDPEADLYAVLLTNRVYPDASKDAILEIRRTLHDAVLDAWR